MNRNHEVKSKPRHIHSRTEANMTSSLCGFASPQYIMGRTLCNLRANIKNRMARILRGPNANWQQALASAMSEDKRVAVAHPILTNHPPLLRLSSAS
uniref:Uncharacterized protein n=1 Tax=Ascaris lumbricoides TaxID=6252 RepID=A0A0M3HYC4_ASCLU